MKGTNNHKTITMKTQSIENQQVAKGRLIGTRGQFSVISDELTNVYKGNEIILTGYFCQDSDAWWFNLDGQPGEKAFDEVGEILDYVQENF